MIYDTLLDDDSFEATCYYAKNVKSLIGLNFKGRPKIISSVLFEAYIKNEHKGPSVDNMIYKFNDIGNVIEYSDKYKTLMYSYDKEGTLLELNHYNSNDLLKHNTKFISKGGILTDCINSNQQGNQIARYSFVFDKNQNLIESSVFDGNTNKLYAKYLYTYDFNKFCIKREVIFNDNIENNFTRTFQYDEFGNIIAERTYTRAGIAATTDFKYYDYDSFGNWQTRHCLDYEDSIEERKLIY